MNLIIKDGSIITDSDQYKADILIQDGKIAQIGKNLPISPDFRILNAEGKFVLPGGVDPHVHFDLEMAGTVSSDDHYTGHKAAAFGGTTTVLDFIPQTNNSLISAVDDWHNKVREKAVIDYGFHMNISLLNEQIEKEIPLLKEKGINTLKVFMAYNDSLRLHDDELFRVFQIAAAHDMLVMLHAENGDVIDMQISQALLAGHTDPIWHALTRPAYSAAEAVFRGIALKEMTGANLYIVHMNTGVEMDQLRYARSKSLDIIGETCPHYLLLSNELLREEDGAKYICSPPLRSESDQEQIWQAIEDGLVSVIATDHCAFFYEGTNSIEYEGKQVQIPGKELGRHDFTKIPNGLPGVGDRLPIIWQAGVKTGRISPNRFVALTSTNPARIFGLYPQKGAILPGSDADLVIWNPNSPTVYGVETARHRTDYNLFEGWELTFMPETVFSRGRILVDHGKWYGERGSGKFLSRQQFMELK